MKLQDRKVRGRYLKVYSDALVPWPLPGLPKATLVPSVGLRVPWGRWGLSWPQLMPFEGPSFLELSSCVVLLQSGLWYLTRVLVLDIQMWAQTHFCNWRWPYTWWGKVLASRTGRFLRSKLQVGCKVIGPMDVRQHCECRPPSASRHSFPRAGASTSACHVMCGHLPLCFQGVTRLGGLLAEGGVLSSGSKI